MKIFISWSGRTSNLVAQALRHWLPAVLQATRPYYSPDDIAKGTRWSGEVALELQESKVGILCVTRENLTAPWLMFEAGALAKSLDQSRVIPLLVGVEPTDLSGPLAQFQAARFEHSEVRQIVSVINNQLGASALDDGVLNTVFEKWWPDLQARIGSTPLTQSSPPNEAVRSDRDLLEEMLSLLRARTFKQPLERASMVNLASLHSIPIDGLDITARTVFNLRSEEILTVGELLQHTETQLLKTPNIGRRALAEINAALTGIGLQLRSEQSGADGG